MLRVALAFALLGVAACGGAEVTRYPLPNNSTFPIAQAVEVSAGTTLVYHSGTVPGPANAGGGPPSTTIPHCPGQPESTFAILVLEW